MARTVIALFDDFVSANDAVRELVEHGFLREDISMVVNDSGGTYSRYLDARIEAERSQAAESAGVGAGVGAVIGGLAGLLVGLGALTIPGIGPVIAAGPLAAALSGLAGAGVGAVAGGITGGLVGALTEMGVPEERAGEYAEGVRRGATMVTVRTGDERADEAAAILNRYGPLDLDERVSEWQATGGAAYSSESSMNVVEGKDRPEDVLVIGDVEMSDYRDDEGFSFYNPRFRNHFETTMTHTGYSYDQFLPAYRYGYDLAVHDRFREYDTWTMIEPEARRYWEEENPGTWEHFESSVRHAWEEAKEARR